MKKIGILIFAAAIIFGVFISSFFSFGKVSQDVVNFSINKKTKGSGNIASESRDIRDFSGIDVSGVVQVEIISQQDFAVEVEADDNLLPLIQTEVRNGVLHIRTEDSVKSHNGLKVRISAPDIESIEASGATRVLVSGVRNDALRVDTSGASKVTLSGETAKLGVEVSGASNIDAEDLKAGAADIEASGASNVSVFTTGQLRADASGASKIIYSGSPANIEKTSSGVSSIREK